jgi:hypothetical protein
MARRITFLASIAILALGVVAASSAQAAYVVTFEEVGSNVVETGSGMVDPTDLTSTAFGTNEERVSAGSATYFSGGAGAIEMSFPATYRGQPIGGQEHRHPHFRVRAAARAWDSKRLQWVSGFLFVTSWASLCRKLRLIPTPRSARLA